MQYWMLQSIRKYQGKKSSGLYLRLKMLQYWKFNGGDHFVSVEVRILHAKKLELHNRWNLEFNTDVMPGYHTLVDEKKTKRNVIFLE